MIYKNIKEKLKGIVSDIIISLLSSAIVFILGLLFRSFISEEFALWFEHTFGIHISLAVTFITVSAILIIIVINQRVINHTVLLPKKIIDRHFKTYAVSMMFESRERMTMRNVIKAVFKSPVFNYLLSYHWTGSGSEAKSNRSDAEVSIYKSSDTTEKWQLDFHSPKEPRKPFDIDYTIYASDYQRRAKTIFGYNVYYPTDELTIELCFNFADPDLLLKDISFVCRFATSDIIIYTEKADPSINKHVKRIKNPKLFHTYRYEWTYRDNHLNESASNGQTIDTQ